MVGGDLEKGGRGPRCQEGRGVQGQDWEGAGFLAPAAVAKCHRLVAANIYFSHF